MGCKGCAPSQGQTDFMQLSEKNGRRIGYTTASEVSFVFLVDYF